nr:hypothetical protein [uncultured Psychroserpens sp.]
MQGVAEHYISFMSNEDIELIIYPSRTIQKPYGNIYFYDSKRHFETGEFSYHVPSGPFLVEKETGRVVSFGTAYPKEYYFEAYENGTLQPSLDLYWYPEEERYSHE